MTLIQPRGSKIACRQRKIRFLSYDLIVKRIIFPVINALGKKQLSAPLRNPIVEKCKCNYICTLHLNDGVAKSR